MRRRDVIRKAVRERAESLCEYCQLTDAVLDTPHTVDHIVAEQHHGKTILANLAWCCQRCNWHKGPNLLSVDPRTGRRARLFNPRIDDWSAHFEIQGEFILGRTPIGRATITLLQINALERLRLRRTMLDNGLWPPSRSE